MVQFCKDVVESKWFQSTILIVILVAAVGVGLETYPDIVSRFGPQLNLLNWFIIAIFCVEIGLKMSSHGRHWFR